MHPQPSLPLRTAPATALLVLAALLQVPGFRHDAYAQGEGKLAGTWQVQVSLLNCTTGAPLAPSFESLHTYIGGGSWIEQGSRLGTAGTRVRTVGQGVWTHTQGRTYETRHKFYRFDGNGVYLGGNDISRTIELGAKGDWFKSVGVGREFDPAGTFGPPGCITETGERLQLE